MFTHENHILYRPLTMSLLIVRPAVALTGIEPDFGSDWFSKEHVTSCVTASPWNNIEKNSENIRNILIGQTPWVPNKSFLLFSTVHHSWPLYFQVAEWYKHELVRDIRISQFESLKKILHFTDLCPIHIQAEWMCLHSDRNLHVHMADNSRDIRHKCGWCPQMWHPSSLDVPWCWNWRVAVLDLDL